MKRFHVKPWLLAGLMIIAAGLAYHGTDRAEALVAAPYCSGNICSGSITVGGQTVQYSHTEHLSPSGELRIRLNGGVYSTDSLISTIIHGLPSFSTWEKLANPSNGAVYLPDEDVNPGRTAYERSDADGCLAPDTCIVDQVMSVRFAGLAEGEYDFSLSVVQNGDTGGKTLTFYVDAAAPDNLSESATWGSIGMNFPCADSIDNDLDYGPDCADGQPSYAAPNCVGLVGDVGSLAVCEQPESTCNDLFDNDADGLIDCLDPSCDGLVGQPGGSALCMYGNEYGLTACGDGFNNDGDVFVPGLLPLTDCVDNAWVVANGGNASSICWKTPAYGCPATETSCVDLVDNDKDRSYDPAWDMSPTTGGEILVDDDGNVSPTGRLRCLDYDCGDAGHPDRAACPSAENVRGADVLNGDFTTDPLDLNNKQCFNGVDDDLDGLRDCADPDCSVANGVVNPDDPTKSCRDKEFEPGVYQFCGNFFQGNPFDDDGDGPANCSDTDCRRMFGNCGPCPDREDYTYRSCADTTDNDSDGPQNCGDPDCDDRIGTLGAAALCAATEDSDAVCGDGFNNDPSSDALIDCADLGCAGRLGPAGQTCTPTGAPGWPFGESAGACSDGMDNDADGARDCADSGCWGSASCASKTWSDAACVLVPRTSPPTAFTSNDPTVLATVRLATRINQTDVINLSGSGTYASVTLIIGDNTDATRYYPYAAAAVIPPLAPPVPGCVLSGADSNRFAFTAVAGHAIQIYNTPGPDIDGFDITLTCAVPATPALIKTYPISLSALKVPGDVPEYGDVNFTTTLHEATAPTITEIEPEGALLGVVRVPYGGTVRWRAVPDEPGGAPPASSGICSCGITLASGTYPTTSDCVAVSPALSADAIVTASAVAEDGSNNVSASEDSSPYLINVTPTLDQALALSQPTQPFFRDANASVTVSAGFLTGTTESFDATCEVYVTNDAGQVIGGPGGPSATFAGAPLGNEILCSGIVLMRERTAPAETNALGAAPPDGRYYVTIRANDDVSPMGDTADEVESNRRVAYVCNSVPGAGGGGAPGCEYADFDYDGTPEGLFTKTPPLYGDVPLACDNCLGLANSDQKDENANGIGDACEPDQQYGRCEVDTEIVCLYDSDDSDHACPDGELCCPGPSLGDYGLCQDGVTTCDVDGDCALVTGTPACTIGKKDPQFCVDSWGICTIGGNVCFEDDECTSLDAAVADGTGNGLCQVSGTTCKHDADCPTFFDDPTDICIGADFCDNLASPWLETRQGSIFSGERIAALSPPPQNKFNATFCITAKDVIVNFASEQGTSVCAATDPLTGTETDPSSPYRTPTSANAYTTALGKIDVSGLLAGKYGAVETVAEGLLENRLGDANGLGGRIIRVSGDVTVDATTIFDGNGVPGGGTVIVDGGNLTINGDIRYASTGSGPTSLAALASLGWIVLTDGSGDGGNVYVDGDVEFVAGAFYVGGDDGFWSVTPGSPTGKQLVVSGLAVARNFVLNRSYKSQEQGSERFIYDGRAVVNPPPGFADITKSLPAFSDALPQ